MRGGGGVVACCLECFLEGDALALFAYGVPPWVFGASRYTALQVAQDTCAVEEEEPAEAVLRRANAALADDDPAYYCKTGRHYASRAVPPEVAASAAIVVQPRLCFAVSAGAGVGVCVSIYIYIYVCVCVFC
uniref:Uncharacterized protein n=1 Tax=Oryza brachyantha TaxID=4533 RepID=J3NE45_ORYBR